MIAIRNTPPALLSGIVLALGLLGVACGEDTGRLVTMSSGSDLLPSETDEIVVAFGRETSSLPDADWTSAGARVEDDSLVLEIEHAGGCREHEYWLVAVDGFTVLPNAGVIPLVDVPVRLAHEDRGDACEALLTPTLRFDLAPLAGAYRDEFGTGPAFVLIRVPEGQGASTFRAVSWTIE